MQEKKHPLLAFLMPPAVGGATLRVAWLGAAACGGGLGCCGHRLLPPAAAGFIAIYALRAAAMRRLRSETLAAARSAAR